MQHVILTSMHQERIYDTIETVQGLEVTRDRTKLTISLKQEGSIHNYGLNVHFLEWKTVPLEEPPTSTLPPMPPRMSQCDILLDSNVLTDRN